MQLALFLTSALCSLSSFAAASPSRAHLPTLMPRDVSPEAQFQLSYLFTAKLSLGSPGKPINITGGVLEDEPIVNGTVYGPAINATIKMGLAYPQVIENGAIQLAQVVAYGSTDDGDGVSISEIGVGRSGAQVTRIQFSICGGDKYKTLRDGYILASTDHTTETEALVNGYLVTLLNTTSSC